MHRFEAEIDVGEVKLSNRILVYWQGISIPTGSYYISIKSGDSGCGQRRVKS
jgi:hypothetical protein